MKLKIKSAFFMTWIVAALLAAPVLAKGNAPEYISVQFRQTFIIAYSAIAVVISLIVFITSNAKTGEDSGLWKTAVVFSLLCVAGIISIWYIVNGTSPDDSAPAYYEFVPSVVKTGECSFVSGDEDTHAAIPSADNPIHLRQIKGNDDVTCLIDEQNAMAKKAGVEAPIFIPTGAFVQSIEFGSANDVTMTGYIWQRYSNDLPENITIGYVLPEGGSDIYGTKDNAVYIREENGSTTYGWYFNTTLRQTFDYERYPFDRQDVWLRMWHADFDKNTILIPDLIGYDAETGWTEEPDVFLGLERDFVLERMTLERTYFSYHYNHYNVNFGIDQYIGQSDFPELYFNIGVRREALDAFVAYMIPLVILLLMSFGVQFIVTQDPEKMTMHGISTTGLITYYASLFFIGILAQLDIRRTLNAPGVVYIEYFYFVLYAVLLLQTVNSIIFAASDDVGFLEYKDNLYPKIIFFPLTLGVMFAFTAILFY